MPEAKIPGSKMTRFMPGALYLIDNNENEYENAIAHSPPPVHRHCPVDRP